MAAVPGMRAAFAVGTGCLPRLSLQQRGDQKERGKTRQDIKTPQRPQILQNKDQKRGKEIIKKKIKKKIKRNTDTPRPFALTLCGPTQFNYFWEAGAGEGEVLCIGC